MKTLPLSSDGAVHKRLHINDDEVIIESVQDVTPILDFNQALKTAEFDKKRDFWPIGQIPRTVLANWIKEFKRTRGIGYYQAPPEERLAFIRKKLNDRDNRKLRGHEFKI